MRLYEGLTTDRIHAIFVGEILAHDGHVHETFNDNSRLFVRSTLPQSEEIVPGDRVQSGVALRAAADCVSVHPYTVRLVCSNGAIVAQTLHTRRIDLTQVSDPVDAGRILREAIQSCCAPEVFSTTARAMRTAADVQVDMLIMLMRLLSRLPQEALRNKLIANMIEDVAKERLKDKCSRYDLMNVVTATARETRDPEEKWRLEELGGEIAAGGILTPRLEIDAAAHSAVFRVSTGWSTRNHIRPSWLGFRTC